MPCICYDVINHGDSLSYSLQVPWISRDLFHPVEHSGNCGKRGSFFMPENLCHCSRWQDRNQQWQFSNKYTKPLKPFSIVVYGSQYGDDKQLFLIAREYSSSVPIMIVDWKRAAKLLCTSAGWTWKTI